LLKVVDAVLPFVDYFMPGFEEAVMMCGLSNRLDAIRFFLDKGAGHTVFKMGGMGSSAAWKENGQIREIRFPALDVPIVDSTGYGDAYCAGFITGLSLGYDIQKACELGTAAGGLVIQGLGSDAGIKDLNDTLKFMKSARRKPLTEIEEHNRTDLQNGRAQVRRRGDRRLVGAGQEGRHRQQGRHQVVEAP
jgi:sugar/nucleoside kinase (ribokinase family)